MQPVTCVGCDALCDDLILDGDALVSSEIDQGCSVSENWFQSCRAALGNEKEGVGARLLGAPIAIDFALSEIVQRLKKSVSPLITGLGGCHTKTVRSAIQLADRLGATIDPSTTGSRRNRLDAFVHQGGFSCTLGEVKQRSELLIFWNVRPEKIQPCLLKKFGLTQEQHGKTVIVFTDECASQFPWADHVFQMDASVVPDILSRASILISDSISESGFSQEASDDLGEMPGLTVLAEQLSRQAYPVLIHDDDPGDDSSRSAWLALSNFVQEVNQKYRLHTLNLGGGESGGAGSFETATATLAWQTGFPCCVSFSQQSPKHHLSEYSTEQLLRNREVDICLVVGSLPESLAASDVWRQNDAMDVITIGSGLSPELSCQPAVEIVTGVDGFHNRGTFFRFDHVPLPARAIEKTERPSMCGLLDQIYEQVK